MSIFQGDVIIKLAIELAIDDMKKHPFIIDDVFSSFIENPLLNTKYGIKEVLRAREFILNNKINIYMAGRVDKEEFPAVVIGVGQSREDDSLATLGDNTVCVEDLTPDEIGQKITYIIPPFTPVSYNQETGVIEVPEDIKEYIHIRSGMVAVDPETGAGFLISDKVGNHGIQITPGSELTGDKVGVVPEYQVYRARRERIISQETYTISCFTHGDPSTLIFLHSVVKYGLLRYREALLEHENFQLSSIRSSEIGMAREFDVENVYTRQIILTGQTEETWLKTPFRIIEAIELSEEGVPGIEISGADTPDTIQVECESWITIEDD